MAGTFVHAAKLLGVPSVSPDGSEAITGLLFVSMASKAWRAWGLTPGQSCGLVSGARMLSADTSGPSRLNVRPFGLLTQLWAICWVRD